MGIGLRMAARSVTALRGSVGKGLCIAPRDALITETTPKELRGRAFGLHRAMDTNRRGTWPPLGLAFLGNSTATPTATI